MKKGRAPKWLSAARAQNRSPADKNFDWLDRALSRAGVLAPADAKAAIEAGRVRVNGKVQKQALSALRPGDRVELDGRAVSVEAQTLALMLHKPKGVVCAATDPEGIGTVFDALYRVLPAELRGYGWHAIGRLDRNTTGLCLFTNDERLVAHVTSPESHLPKRYVAHVSGALSNDKLEPLRKGMTLDDGPTRPAIAEIRAEGVVELTLTEGRHHQVKRMLGAVGLPVLELHREAVGELVLDVEVGQLRRLTDDELSERLRFRPHPSSPPTQR
jgi:23S rRNA pseudouridine2605 synthase/16S rRNA pseudouridine516 synthase